MRGLKRRVAKKLRDECQEKLVDSVSLDPKVFFRKVADTKTSNLCKKIFNFLNPMNEQSYQETPKYANF